MARKTGCSLQEDERALSEVIGFILLLGVIVAAFALWMVYVVPVNGREAEITQMNFVKDRFTDYKISMDSLWINSPNGATWSQSGVTLSTSLDLGVGGSNSQSSGLFLPMLSPIASSATLTVKDGGDKMTVNSSSGSADFVLNMSTLEYQSINNYWIQQRYYYQDGGVFLTQDNGTVCRVSPPITIAQVNNGTANVVSVNVVPIQLLGGSSVGGKGPVRVDSTLRATSQTATSQQNTWVNISFDVADKPTALMWMDVLNDTRIRGNITDSTWYTFKVAEDPATKRGTAFMNISGPFGQPYNPDVYLTVQKADYLVILNNIAAGIS
jgi:hypothetical protein